MELKTHTRILVVLALLIIIDCGSGYAQVGDVRRDALATSIDGPVGVAVDILGIFTLPTAITKLSGNWRFQVNRLSLSQVPSTLAVKKRTKPFQCVQSVGRER